VCGGPSLHEGVTERPLHPPSESSAPPSPPTGTCLRLHCPMALRPNALPFTPGAGGAPAPSGALASKQSSSYPQSTNQAPAPSSSAATQSIPNKTSARPSAGKLKGAPRGNQGKRAQTQSRKAERRGRIADEALTADPVFEAVFPRVWMGLRVGDVWTGQPPWTDFVESFVELFDGAEGPASLLHPLTLPTSPLPRHRLGSSSRRFPTPLTPH
jgi:hypothetical protein